LSVDKPISTIEFFVLMTIHDQKQKGLPTATTDVAQEGGYITLKEASERFGYAPDYIGQLIRKGKIEGKQVYANVAWVTTEEAMVAYKAEAGEKRAAKVEPQPSRPLLGVIAPDLVSKLSAKLFAPRMAWVLTIFLRIVSVFLMLVLVVAFYLISVVFDRALSERAEMRLEKNVKSGKVLVNEPRMSYQNNAPFRI